ncbi:MULTISPECIES: transglycosylase family protein [Streptomyces]|uniref:Transglycosylase domain protein n=1 Tax=Streptomyces griseus TaxID=1911 RepID=A0A380NCG2_STRGR|nr:transglycosylase family protein [Streptomyces griseus]SUP37196.1 Transglycosylase domain protein [Streptomyces griseus]
MPYVLTAVAALVLLAPAQHGAAPPGAPGCRSAPRPWGCVADCELLAPAQHGAAPPGAPGCRSAPRPWGCVADCESGGRWDADTGNGYHGGLQFAAATRREFGGARYAPSADRATPDDRGGPGRPAGAGLGGMAALRGAVRADRAHTVEPGAP